MDKQWAEGLNQEEFSKKWVVIFPKCDVVPDVNKWLNKKERQPTGIDPFNEELLEVENFRKPIAKKETTKEQGDIFIFTCEGCEREFKHAVERHAKTALRGHIRHCKELLRKR